VADPVTQFRLERRDSVALVTMDDATREGRPNILGRGALESLAELLPELEQDDFSSLVITGKPGSFSGGADLDEFPRIETREQAIEGSRAGHDLFGRIRALPYPTVAAINAGVLGGGVELALHCDYRVIAEDVRHLASPECLLGFVPAWGATQLAPRLVGPEAAVKLIVANPMRQNKMLTAEQAHELGLVDRVTAPEHLIDEAIAIAAEQPSREAPDLSATSDVVTRARSQLDESLHGAAPAPYRALELIDGAQAWTLEEGYRAEEEALADLLFTPQAKASLYAFDVVERRSRRGAGRPPTKPRPVRRIGIAGAGLMASQLATLFLRRARVPVVLRDLEQEIVDRALESIRDDLADAAARRGRLDPQEAVSLAALAEGTTSYEGFEDCDLVIEAVFEELGVKQEVFGELEGVVSEQCVLATNTSALSVTAMGEGLEHPERLVGIHFFNPVALMPLVELVRTPETNDAALATAWAFADRLRKRPVLVHDAPGFVVNRLLTRLMIVVLESVERGSTVEEADEAVLSLGLPMAPSVLLQMVGEQVATHVRETLHAAYPDRFVTTPGPQRSIEEIREAVLEALSDEVSHILEEGVVDSPKDVDAALILGAGFPFFMGGLTPYLREQGYSFELSPR
jgi:3-hydroxyacyl-CoA dehydrogenase/enoyl-CoA hydratase/carnithine racemase